MTSRSRAKSRVARPGRPLYRGDLLAQRLPSGDERQELAVELGERRAQFVEIHLRSTPFGHRDYWTDWPLRPQVRVPGAATASMARHGYHARMSTSIKPLWTETLPDPLPANPLEVAAEWLAQARVDAAQPNPEFHGTRHGGRQRSTVGARGALQGNRPRRGLHRLLHQLPTRAKAETRGQSARRGGFSLGSSPPASARRRAGRAAVRTPRTTPIFETRPWQSRIGAWASRQSEPVESRAALGESVAAAARRFGIPYGGPGTREPETVAVRVPRPPHWGGYRLHVDAVELWVEGEFRIHDRARWTRIRRRRGRDPGAAPPGP